MLLVTTVTLVPILSDALEGLVDKCWAVKVVVLYTTSECSIVFFYP